MNWDRKTPPLEAVTGIPLPEGGFRLKPYRDSADNWTIGAGSLHMPDGSRVTASSRAITVNEAHALFASDLMPCVEALAAAIGVAMTSGEAAGLISWLFNCGTGSIDGSVIQQQLEANRGDLVVRQLAGWCEEHDPTTHMLTPELGLMRRRRFDGLLFQGLQPQDAYDQAWKLQWADGLAAYHAAFADAAQWGYAAASQRVPAPAPAVSKPRPAPRPVPRAAPAPAPVADDSAETAALNEASAAGTLSIEGSI